MTHSICPTLLSHAKGGRRYRCYVSRRLATSDRAAMPVGRRIRAGEIDSLVAERLLGFFADAAQVQRALDPHVIEVAKQRRLIVQASPLAQSWNKLPSSEQKELLIRVDLQVELRSDQIESTFTFCSRASRCCFSARSQATRLKRPMMIGIA